MTPGKVYGCLEFQKFGLFCAKRKFSQIEPQFKIKKPRILFCIYNYYTEIVQDPVIILTQGRIQTQIQDSHLSQLRIRGSC